MALLEWPTEMNVGIKIIDEEHQKLIAFLNALYEAIENDRGAALLTQTLGDVMAYTSYHFVHEEEIFMATEYPKKEQHKAKHKHLIEQLMDIQNKSRLGQFEGLSIELMIILKEWLIDHIQGMDMGYVPYIKKKAK